MVEDQVDVQYISLHRYIRDTPSDTEVPSEHQLRADRSTWPVEKNIEKHTKLEIKTWAFGVGELTKTLDYQRANSRKYQIVRTHTEGAPWIQDPASTNLQ